MLIVLTGGELAWDTAGNDFDWSITTAVGKNLQGAFRAEPLYVDLRWARGLDDLTLRNLRFRDAALNLAAAIRGVRKDELDGADVRQMRRNRRLVQAGVTAIAVAACIAIWQAIVATQQRNEATTQRTTAQARRLVAEAQAVLADPLAASESAVQGLLASLALRPSNDDARTALARAVDRLEPQRLASLPWPGRGAMRDLTFSRDGAWLVAVTDAGLVLWSTENGRIEWQQDVPIPEGAVHALLAPDGKHALVVVDRATPTDPRVDVLRVDLASRSVVPSSWERVRDAAVIGERLVVLNDAGAALAAFDAVSGQVLWRATFGAAVQAARLVARQAGNGSSGGPAAMPTMASAMPLAVAPLSAVADMVVVDGTGQVKLGRFGDATLASAAVLPNGARVLTVGESGEVIGVRLRDGRIAVLDTRTGRERWRSADVVGKQATPAIAFAGADRFVLAPGSRGVVLQGLDSEVRVEAEHERRSDWDMAGLSNPERYSAIIRVQASANGEILATAWKDGRVDVWRAGLKARYGAIDAMPRANFEAVARFDHGEALGATVTWAAPPVLELSPSGRLVASQSMGLETNAVGGVVASHPKLRVWDTRTGGEIARFQRRGGMLIRFSPRDDLAVTASRTEQPVLELWRLGAPGAPVQRDRVAVDLTSTNTATPTPAASEDPKLAWMRIASVLATMSLTTDEVWLGSDLQLRSLDTRQRQVSVLEDLAPAFVEARNRTATLVRDLLQREGASLPQRVTQILQGTADMMAQSAAAGAPATPGAPTTGPSFPPAFPLPLAPIAVSADGRRAVVKLGPQLRVHMLDGSRQATVVDSGDEGDIFWQLPGMLSVAPPAVLALSPDGRFVAVSRTSTPAMLDYLRRLAARTAASKTDGAQAKGAKGVTPLAFPREIAVIDLDGREQTATTRADAQILSMQTPLGLVAISDRLLALDREGRRLALEHQEIVQEEGAPPRLQSRIVVRDIASGKSLLETPATPLPSPMDFGARAVLTPPAAAFSPSGRRLVIDTTRPACGMKTMSHPMTMLQMTVPSCPEFATTLAEWDLSSRTRLREVRYEHAPAQVAGGLPPFPGAPERRPASLLMPREDAVERTVVEWPAQPTTGGAASIAVERITERLSLDTADPLIEQACRRLPPTLRTIDAAEWARRLPGETLRVICPGAAP
jgi:hypothetical protein